MHIITDIIGLVIGIVLMLGMGLFCLWFLKKRIIDKKWIGVGTQFVSEHVYSQFQRGDTKSAIQHIQFEREEDKDEDFGSGGVDSHSNNDQSD